MPRKRHTRAEVYEDAVGEYRFRIVAMENGEILASSEGYRHRTDATKAADRILFGALQDHKVELGHEENEPLNLDALAEGHHDDDEDDLEDTTGGDH